MKNQLTNEKIEKLAAKLLKAEEEISKLKDENKKIKTKSEKTGSKKWHKILPKEKSLSWKLFDP